MEILERHIGFEHDPEAFANEWQPEEDELSNRIAAARDIVDEVQYSRADLRLIALMTSQMQIDGHRADLVILKTARAHAAFHQRKFITQEDILTAIELAIPHRLKRGPFSDAQIDMQALAGQMDQMQAEISEDEEGGEASQMAGDDSEMSEKKKVNR
jgi:Mg-chelatase subunit ChlI